MADEKIIQAAAEALREWSRPRYQQWPTLALRHDEISRISAAVVAAVEPLIREQIAKDIESHYLGPDSGRSPLDGRDAPDAHLRNAYDEGLEVAVRIARGDQHE